MESPKIQGKKVLIVDDDYYFRMALEKGPQQHHHFPICAESAKQAQQIISLNEVDLVISDIRMPEMDGIQLLQWTKANRPMPFILMTGFSELIEMHDAVQMGADAFLAKPFKTEELLKAIEDCFPKEKKIQVEDDNLDDQFCKISIDDFVSGREMKQDIFVRMNESKYVKIAHSGEDIAVDRIRIYKSKNIHFLYMRKTDFKNYLNFNLVLSKAIGRAKNIDQQKKVNFLKHTSEVMMQSLYVNEMSKDDFAQASALVENAVLLIGDSEAAGNLLTALSSHSDFLYAHSVGVSFYASMIGKKLGWTSPTTIMKLSMGGLLHDIGKKEISRTILDKPRQDLTADEIALIETHPTRGMELMTQLQCGSTDILQIIYEHHENNLGLGYPKRVKSVHIHPLAKVVSVANAFCNLVIKNPNSPGMKYDEAIKQMLALNREYYDTPSLNALMSIFDFKE